jgi:ATP-binding cassette subfamily C protein
LISALTSNLGPLGNALGACRRHFVVAAAFSALLNVLFIAPTLYMLQIYDRVVPTQGKMTLLFLTLVVLFALATLALLDLLRSRLLVRASVQLDAQLAGAILESSLAHSDKDISKQALRDFDTLRQTLAGPGTLAAFDAPWTPIYVLVCFIVHPWLGVLALFGAGALLIIAWRNERATRPSLQRANQIAGQTHVSQEYSIASADVVRAAPNSHGWHCNRSRLDWARCSRSTMRFRQAPSLRLLSSSAERSRRPSRCWVHGNPLSRRAVHGDSSSNF